MDSKQIQEKANKRHQTLKQRYQGRKKIIDNLSQEVNDLEAEFHVSTDSSAKLHIKQLIPILNHEKALLKHYTTQVNDAKFIVITNWSENDIYDSNNQVYSNQKLSKWKHLGCKVYGKLGPQSKATNSVDNHGFFANFNYPINIVKNPDIYFFDQTDLKHLYLQISAHNDQLGPILVKVAKAGTITVHKFKKLFGLTLSQVKAKLNHEKALESNNAPTQPIDQLRKYYEWELSQRRKIAKNDDLTQYDQAYDTSKAFNSDLNNYKTPGHEDSDIDENPDSDLDGLSYSDFAAGQEYEDPYSDY